jgi:hypothetical protein
LSSAPRAALDLSSGYKGGTTMATKKKAAKKKGTKKKAAKK